MNITAALTIIASEDGASFTIEDHDASVPILKFQLSPEQFCAALGRLAYIKCDAEVGQLNLVGKVHENKQFAFPIPESDYKEREHIAYREAMKACPVGWTPDNYFRSQDSFFTKDGKPWARTTIRRWVDKVTTQP